MKNLEAQVPEILLDEVIELAAKQHTSVDQIVSLALTAQVSAWRTRESIASRAGRVDWQKVDGILARVPDVPPQPGDERWTMTTIETHIPDSLYKQVKSLAERESISVDQLVSIALAGQVSAWLTKDYLAERAARGSWEKALAVFGSGTRCGTSRPRPMIKEHDRVVLKTPIPSEKLEPGDVGTVVHVYEDGKAYEVEFVTLDGHTAAVATLVAAQVRPVSRRDLTHVRELQVA